VDLPSIPCEPNLRSDERAKRSEAATAAASQSAPSAELIGVEGGRRDSPLGGCGVGRGGRPRVAHGAAVAVGRPHSPGLLETIGGADEARRGSARRGGRRWQLGRGGYTKEEPPERQLTLRKSSSSLPNLAL